MARSSVTRFEPASSRRNDGDGTDYSDYYIRLFILAVLGVFYALTFRIPDRTAELRILRGETLYGREEPRRRQRQRPHHDDPRPLSVLRPQKHSPTHREQPGQTGPVLPGG